MDKLAFLRSAGRVRLPPGFRFNPTDEELVVHYLRPKAFSFPLPASIIAELDLGKHDPWDLPGAEEREKYFFNRRVAKYPKGGRPNRATSSGYWKTTGRDKAVVAARRNEVVGMKKILVFYHGKSGRCSRTDWIMHEYRLAGVAGLEKNSDQGLIVPSEDWVLCRIFKKRRATKMEEDPELYCGGGGGVRFIDFFLREEAESSSSDSSCVTDDASDGSSGGEEAICG